MGRPKVSREEQFEGFPIKVGKEGNRQEILVAIKRMLDYMWAKCNRRLYVCHAIIHLPGVPVEQENAILSNCLQSLRRTLFHKKIKNENVWVKETGAHGRSEQSHFHVAFVIDEKCIQSHWKIQEHIYKLLEDKVTCVRGYIYFAPPKNNCCARGMLVKKEIYDFADAFNWLSYLAKCDTKGPFASYQKSFGYSKGYKNLSVEEPETEPETETDTMIWIPILEIGAPREVLSGTLSCARVI
jgi:hypothetical protein